MTEEEEDEEVEIGLGDVGPGSHLRVDSSVIGGVDVDLVVEVESIGVQLDSLWYFTGNVITPESPDEIKFEAKDIVEVIDSSDEKSNSSPEVTEKIERTDVGISAKFTLTRGTGTRDQDGVTIKSKTESLEELQEQKDEILSTMEEMVTEMRDIQPDQEENQ